MLARAQANVYLHDYLTSMCIQEHSTAILETRIVTVFISQKINSSNNVHNM